ncbi:Cytoplasm to vacuole targeting Vps64, putative [Penicillium digitatum PHI26]|uniref:Cytoplasm to vacuole targeting Vps64, putative n=3 Tax=Penicillium digitatum TaxID=36651 RepID=K9FKJ8_PEND2|nr:Cytoplasm to vacuole targeting Vps64, putative [Penicillium digitatum Pd1]EKV06874.1 Cytoplasm to vacuole targeting Vps64, putative [Penicillium digitatum Pd1]EKV08782.1 Cytoplasm to vacuole targeting Vps64, putative [Penicillium digitatum PHI26]
MNGTFDRKQINVPYYPEVLRIGRQTNAKTVPTPLNGFFDSKVLSRQHAEVWADKSGKIWIRDVKSSNGTFVNGHRLSPENRESEPHELRESDTLELGIDIVSEDQSTIVHHKVSSKVEHAGIYGTTPSILDLNFGDLDPASGGGLLPSPLSQPLSHMRGRAGSNASSRSAQSVTNNQLNALHQQRQMNYWNSPISIEQVVKRLTSELKSAKQQTTDLSQADEFLTTIMKPGYAEKEKIIKPSPLENNAHRQMNGRPKMPRVDSFSRFSDPPAPPPQQPLPEKPVALSRSASESFTPLRRSDTEKPKSATSSPVSRDSSQILNLIEALSSAKREIETHGTRVKELEILLCQEQAARKLAEDKVNELEMRSLEIQEFKVENSIVSPSENGVDGQKEQAGIEATVQVNGIHPSETPTSSDSQTHVPVEDKSAELQTRLESMMEEMAEMRKQIASFKDRAEKAEDETTESRKSLNEMIETLRQERAEKASATVLGNRTDTHDRKPGNIVSEKLLTSDDTPTDSKMKTTSMQGFDPVLSQNKELDAAVTSLATRRHRYNYVEEASPYASMFGVVLLGVGLMAYLNSWQKMDR